jgi:hypothetical protein
MQYCDVSPAATTSTEKLAEAILANYGNPSKSNTIDVPAQVESLLQCLGATTSDSGGKVTYYGSAPSSPIDCHTELRAQSRSRSRRS